MLIDLSQFECSVAMIGTLLLSSAVNGTVPRRRGNRSDQYAPQGVYPCSGIDNWCALSIESNQQWQALADLIGRHKWSDDTRFATLLGRQQSHDEIDEAIANWTRQFPSEDVEERLRAVGITAERVRRIDQVLEGTDCATVFRQVSERRVGSMRTTVLPFTLSGVNLPTMYSAPSLGEHSETVLRDWLNCSDAEIDELKRSEALQ